jgi:membrane protease YdiL (CAAX protease family)
MPTSLADHFLFLLIAIVYPCYTTIDWYRRLRPALETGGSRARRRAYQQTALEQMLLTGAVLVWWFLEDRTAREIGLGVPGGIAFWIAVFITIAVAFLMWRQLASIRSVSSARERVLEQFRGAAALIAPRGRDERRDWAIMSSSVGVCEEILYRGFFLWYVLKWMPEAAAIPVAAIVFGLAHLYQGWGGVIRSGILGMIFCFGYLFIGSLWALMALHAVVDIGSGSTLSAAAEGTNKANQNNEPE